MQNKKEQESGLDFLLVKTTAQKADAKKIDTKKAVPKGRTATTVKTTLMTKLTEYAKKHKKDVLTALDEAVDSYIKNDTVKGKK